MWFMMLGRWIYTTDPLVTETSLVEVEIAIRKLKRYKIPRY
jgi:hypothetical protein